MEAVPAKGSTVGQLDVVSPTDRTRAFGGDGLIGVDFEMMNQEVFV